MKKTHTSIITYMLDTENGTSLMSRWLGLQF